MATTKKPTAPQAGVSELNRLRQENKEMRARLDRIAELAGGEEEDLDEELEDEDDDLDDEDEDEEEDEEE